MSETNQKLQEANGKFKKAVGNIAAILKSENHLKNKGTVPSAEVQLIVDELLSERIAENRNKLKEGLKKAMDGYVTLEKELKAKRDELTALEIQKKNEFSKAVEELAKSIEGMEEIVNLYQQGLDQQNQ